MSVSVVCDRELGDDLLMGGNRMSRKRVERSRISVICRYPFIR